MIDRILPAVLAAALFLGVGGYTLASLDEKSLRLAETSRDVCYARRGIDSRRAPPVASEATAACARPMRDYESRRLWRFAFAAAVGATCAFLVTGGLLILRRRYVQALDI